MRERGFTLIELAVVLAIVGLITTWLLKGYMQIRVNQTIVETDANHDAIEAALRTFILHTSRLPCPADGTLGPAAAGYGTEDCAGAFPLVGPNDTFLAGVIPWADLGLQEAKWDGSSRQYAYAVLFPATNPQSYATDTSWFVQDLRVVTDATDPVNTNITPPDGVVAVVVSYGANGSGAFNPDGGTLPAPPATADNELENQDGDLDVADSPYSDDAVTPFDDRVRAYTEADLMQPLVESGSLMSREATTRERMERIANALLAFAIADNNPANDPDGPPTPVGCYCQAVPSDPVFCAANPLNPACQPCVGGCPRTTRNGLPLSITPPPTGLLFLQVTDGVDAWGANIIYTANALVSNPGPGATIGLYSAATAAPAFTLQSWGPNGANDACGVDDICITRDATDLVGRIVSSGNRVD